MLSWLPGLGSSVEIVLFWVLLVQSFFDITKALLVSVVWNREQFHDKFDCVNKLDLISKTQCGQWVGFWSINYNWGVERSTYINSIIDIKFDGLHLTKRWNLMELSFNIVFLTLSNYLIFYMPKKNVPISKFKGSLSEMLVKTLSII